MGLLISLENTWVQLRVPIIRSLSQDCGLRQGLRGLLGMMIILLSNYPKKWFTEAFLSMKLLALWARLYKIPPNLPKHARHGKHKIDNSLLTEDLLKKRSISFMKFKMSQLALWLNLEQICMHLRFPSTPGWTDVSRSGPIVRISRLC